MPEGQEIGEGGQRSIGSRTDRWADGRLTVETVHKLGSGVTDFTAEARSGRLVVIGSGVTAPEVTTRLVIGADSEDAARGDVDRHNNFSVMTEGNRMTLHGGSRDDEHTTVSHGSEGDVSVNIRRGTIGPGESFTGVRIDASGKVIAGGHSLGEHTRGRRIAEGVLEREIKLLVPSGQENKYSLTGEDDVVAQGVSGDLKIRSHGKARVTEFDGTADVKAKKADIISAKFRGASTVRTKEGADVEVTNESLGVSVDAPDVDFSDDFVTLNDNTEDRLPPESSGTVQAVRIGSVIGRDGTPASDERRRQLEQQLGRNVKITIGGQSTSIRHVKGYFGPESNPSDSLHISSEGDVKVTKPDSSGEDWG